MKTLSRTLAYYTFSQSWLGLSYVERNIPAMINENKDIKSAL